jgi:plasmid stabilization system protein ParE
MIVRVTDDAAGDLEAIKAFIEDRDAVAAERVMQQIRASIRMLGE